jgi:glutamate/tyrosine decarboxylase-like PLP-dependent enzyme
MDAGALAAAIDRDRAAGLQPFCIVATAGTAATGAIDPLRDIAAVARDRQVWLHVDAAYGGLASICPSVAALFDGIAEADSISLDFHKWGYLPLDCGCILYRHPQLARATFSHDADYTRILSANDEEEKFAFWDYGIDLSRRFRALNVWLLFKYAGVEAITAAIERNIQCAQYLQELIRASEDFEMLVPASLSTACFRYAPRSLPECDESKLNLLNERIVAKLQRGGDVYLSAAHVGHRLALRCCMVNYRTRPADMERVLEAVRNAAAQLMPLSEG